MIRLDAKFLPSLRERISSERQPRLVRGPSLVHESIDLTCVMPIDAIATQIRQLVSDALRKRSMPQDVILAIDLISTKEAIVDGQAQKLAREILKLIDRQFPMLRDRFLGITDEGNNLPLRALLLTGSLALEEIDNEHLFVME